jgi:hypothetical protein
VHDISHLIDGGGIALVLATGDDTVVVVGFSIVETAAESSLDVDLVFRAKVRLLE